MIKRFIYRLFKRVICNHLWLKTYVGYYVDSRYACVKCGKVHKVCFIDEGAWKVSRQAKGDKFE